MPIPRIRFTIGSIMIIIVVIAIGLDDAVATYRLYRNQSEDGLINDGFINDPTHPRWRRPIIPNPKVPRRPMPRDPDAPPPIFLANG